MRITSLVENTTVKDTFGAEHGLSLYIESGNKKILFDMGQTDLFARNARLLGIDLSDVDIAVLSHGHYDHGGGLAEFLRINKKASVFLSRNAFEPHYNGSEKYIGLDTGLKNNDRLVFVDDVVKLDEGILLFSCNDRPKTCELGSFGLNMMKNGDLLPDDFSHEIYMEIVEEGKRILFSGCSHKGIINIIDWFDADVIVGGFHFSKLPIDEKLREYAECLNKSGSVFYTCHCTGKEQFEYMKTYMNSLFYLSSGQSIYI